MKQEICPIKPLSESDILSRAAHKKHLLKKALLWDMLPAALAVLWVCIRHVPALSALPPVMWLVPVRRSVWELGKLLFYPLMLSALLRRICTGRLYRGILTTSAKGILLGLSAWIGGFYLYTGIWGSEFPAANGILYTISLFAAVGYIRSRAAGQRKSSLPGLIFLLLMTGCFVWFTYFPPEIGLYGDLTQALQ